MTAVLQFATMFAAALATIATGAVANGQSAANDRADVRDVALMLDGGPLHLRFHLTLGGRPLSVLRQEYVDRLIASLDRDGDGVISRVEARATPLLAARRRDKAEAFLASLDQNRPVPRSEIEMTVARVGGAPVVFRQDETAAENDLEVFKVLDADASGLLEQIEIAQAALRILERDGDGDECVMFEEFLPVQSMEEMQLALLTGESGDVPMPTAADRMRDAAEPLLPRRLVHRYDKNRDGQLSAEELNWPQTRTAALDADRDGRLSLAELAAFGRTPVDLELTVELEPGEGQRAVTVDSIAGRRVDGAARGDYARFEINGASLTVSHRDLDPIESAVTNAMTELNRMDADANGYLDAEEASLRTRFERGLFDTIDADADGKIFGDEMEDYVRVRAEPSATSCQVNLYDIGRGFFSVLDRNGDGRISVREMRVADESLIDVRQGDNGPVTINDPARSFHIEFVRGAYQLFGRPELMIAQSPTFVSRPTSGPIWFRRMDRNNDGDLTWNEFLGPRAVFQRLDGDGDGLIDPQEAEQAN